MNLSELVDLALASSDHHRVEISSIEPAEVAKEAVGGLTQLVTELVDNAIAFSDPDEKVAITGVFDRDDYLISISDNGVGIPETLLTALNHVLAHPETAQPDDGAPLGIVMVARLAARHGIDVGLVPAVPGTTARVTVPSRLVAPAEPDSSGQDETGQDETPAMETWLEESGHHSGHVIAMTNSARREAEAFLDSVFGPLKGRTASRRPTKTRSNGKGHVPDPSSSPPQETDTQLQTRVPGVNFSVTDDDPSVISGEGAIDIRLNLSRYDEGRKEAAEAEPPEDDAPDMS